MNLCPGIMAGGSGLGGLMIRSSGKTGLRPRFRYAGVSPVVSLTDVRIANASF